MPQYPLRNVVSSRHSSQAFTLIELLVVIAIIALLVSILIPSLDRAKRLARETMCASNIHHLTLASVMYANASDGWLPEMATHPETGVQSDIPPCHWTLGYWRDRFNEEYGVSRDMLYSPCNARWNRDDFYHYANDSTYCVMGYFCFGRYDRLESEAFRSNLVDPPAHRTASSLFPKRLGLQSHYDMLWTDLNRQWPRGHWVTPDDPNRWGANHLYNKDWPSGSHTGHVDGSVDWKSGDDLIYGANYGSVAYYW